MLLVEYIPLISIITATLNSGNKLRNTLDSVLAQNYFDLEYIVIDGVSQDNTIEIIKEYETIFAKQKIKFFWISEKDINIYDAMNKGIKYSKGKYLFFLGSGDVLKRDILNRVEVHLLEKFDFIYGDVYWLTQRMTEKGFRNKYSIVYHNICHQSIFYSYSLFSRLGFYELHYNISADHFFNIKCFSKNANVTKKYIKLTISIYEGGGISDLVKDIRFYKDLKNIVFKYLGGSPYIVYKTRNCFVKILEIFGLKKNVKNLLRTYLHS